MKTLKNQLSKQSDFIGTIKKSMQITILGLSNASNMVNYTHS